MTRDAAARWLTGAEVIIRLLIEWGVTTLFAYPGTSELPLCQAAIASGRLELVSGRGDAEAVFLAGGANLSGRTRAACLLHGARGATNALGAVADLRRNEVPLVAVIGLPSSSSAPYMPPHGEPGLLDALGHFSKAALELPGDLISDTGYRGLVQQLREAQAEALRRPHGPVLIGVPSDVLCRPWLPALAWPEEQPQPQCGPSLDAGSDVRLAVSWLLAAKRPIALLDDYVLRYPSARRDLLAFAEAFDLPLLQVRYDRGAMLFETLTERANPHFVARYNPADLRHRSVFQEVDLLVTVEDRNMYERVVGPLPGERRIAVTSAPAKAAINGYLRREDLVLAGDVAKSLRSLVRAAGDLGALDRVSGEWVARLREASADPPAPAPARRQLAAAIADFLDALPAPVLVDDSQMFGGLLAESYDLLPDRLRVFGDHGGFVGAGLSVATGAALANSGWDVVCCVGDYAFLNGLKGLFCAAESRARLMCLVCNNGGSVSLRKQAAGDFGPGIGLDTAQFLRNIDVVDYGQLCAGIGLRYEHVAWATGDVQETAALTAALAAANDVDRPTVVEIEAPAALDFWGGIWRNRGFDE